MNPELADVLCMVVKTVNPIKVQPLKSRVYKILCEIWVKSIQPYFFTLKCAGYQKGKF